ncbi:MAG: FAD-binding oxidoreductase, partial [Actinobacteria bacterium]|nr:FAD-binding oxidoreductase [Actinomycetota bacterium]
EVGDAYVREDHRSRVRHTRGKSTPDLLRLRSGDGGDAPDVVVLPADEDEVVAVLRICAERGLAVVPFGGGTSVVGGLTATRAGRETVVALDLSRLDGLLAIDEISLTATLQPGLRTPQADALLAEHGLQLGHQPQSYEYATIGGYAATRSSGQASAGYGRFDDLVVGLRLATPEGLWELGRAPATAAGPDLRQLVLGSEGAFGVITSVTVRVRRLPAVQVYEGWRFASFAAGCDGLRRLAQDGPLPTVLRLSDEAETAIGLARGPDAGTTGPASTAEGGCLVVVGHEGTAARVAQQQADTAEVLAGCGGAPLGAAPGEDWVHGRYAGPYLRDALLDVGALAETLETAAFWSALPEVYQAVRSALHDALPATPPLVACHVSHVYPTGASLYFTVVCAQEADPVAQWKRAKAHASRTLLAAGGTITHHHGVGADHRNWLADEIGHLGVDVLMAVKARLDPSGVLNPGVLIP